MTRADYERTVLAYYKKTQVEQKIARFSQNRWVAMHCETVNPNGYQVLLRYDRAEKESKPPLTATKPGHIARATSFA